MATMAADDSSQALDTRPVFRIASAGLEARDLKLVGIVLQHSRFNSYDFRLLPNLTLEQADILLVNPMHPAGLQAVLAAGAVKRRVVTVSALPAGMQPTGRHSIALDQLPMQLLTVLNRVVRTETLAGASAVSLPGSARPAGYTEAPTTDTALAGTALLHDLLADTALAGLAFADLPPADTAAAGAARFAAQKAAAGAIAVAAARMPGDDACHGVPLECQPRIGQFHQAPPRARLQVVVADPSLPAQEQLTRVLQRMGLAVYCAAGSSQALQRLKAQHTDLVITESGLSDGDGFELIRAMRAQSRHRYTPVLLLRSRLHPMDAARARLAGDVTLLTKPLTRQALETVVRQALRASAVLDDLNELLAPG